MGSPKYTACLSSLENWAMATAKAQRIMATFTIFQKQIPLSVPPAGTRGCIDVVFYCVYRNLPSSGACGPGMFCGNLVAPEELAADSDFERNSGAVATCSTSTMDREVVLLCSSGTQCMIVRNGT